MENNQVQPDKDTRQDEDVTFERDKESAIIPLTESEGEQQKASSTDTVLPSKEDTLGNSDFPPLSESEKQPKLEEDGETVKTTLTSKDTEE